MEFEAVAAVVRHVPQPHSPPERGRVIHDHLRATKPEAVFELGTARAVSAGYLAAALEANGRGRVTTVGLAQLGWLGPTREDVRASAGFSHRVSLDRSYLVPQGADRAALRRFGELRAGL